MVKKTSVRTIDDCFMQTSKNTQKIPSDVCRNAGRPFLYLPIKQQTAERKTAKAIACRTIRVKRTMKSFLSAHTYHDSPCIEMALESVGEKRNHP
jgi:hypothetical protein